MYIKKANTTLILRASLMYGLSQVLLSNNRESSLDKCRLITKHFADYISQRCIVKRCLCAYAKLKYTGIVGMLDWILHIVE